MTEVAPATGIVVTVNWALVAPAGTVTLVGTCAEPLLSDSVTDTPPAGAGPLRVTVAVDELPPTTDVGLRLKLLALSRAIVRLALLVAL